MNLYEKFMSQALAEARKAEKKGEVPVGAVIVKGDRVIARAHNMCITLRDPSAHAEIIAMRKAGRRLGNYRLNGTTLFVTIEPCPMCAGAIINGRIKEVIYGARDDKAGADGSAVSVLRNNKLNHHVHVIEGVLKDECQRIIQDFFKKRRTKL